jgi:glycosyltransferase involved in cell wall biosynthesis
MRIVQPIGTIAGTAISKIAITLAEEFAKQGHESALVVWNRDKISRKIDPRVKIIRTNLIGVSRRNILTKLLRIFFKPILGPRLFLVFMSPIISRQLQKKVLDKGLYDVVILHAHSVFNFRHIKTPYLVVAHNTKSKQLLNVRGSWKKAWLLKIYRQVYAGKQVVAVSEGIRQDFIENFGLSAGFLSKIYNPLDIDGIRERAKENPDGAVLSVPYVIAIGRNDRQKRFDRLVRVYAQADIKEDLVILGRAGESKELLAQVRVHGVEAKVHFLGFKSNPYPFLAKAKCLLMTSDYEGFGMVLAEALALGTPVISTDCPSGPREILGGKMDDCLIPVDDEGLYSRRLLQMMQKPLDVENNIVDRFNQAKVATEYLKVLQQQISK